MRTLLLSAVAAVFVAGTANAVTVGISTFSKSAFDQATAGNFVIEDFESGVSAAGPSNDFGSGIVAGGFNTDVGLISSAGGTGSGSTCKGINGGSNCNGVIALTTTEPNGQDGALSNKYLNSLDTDGMVWNVSTGSAFNRLVFSLVDAADIRDVVLTIGVEGSTQFAMLSGSNAIGPQAGNNNQKLIVIDFGQMVNGATVSLLNSNTNVNDAFGLDGAAVGVVPIPATGLLLLGGIGAIGMMRRRKKAA